MKPLQKLLAGTLVLGLALAWTAAQGRTPGGNTEAFHPAETIAYTQSDDLDLQTDCDFVLIGDDTAVGFYVQSYLSTPHDVVLDLCEVMDDGYAVVAKLYDDGQYDAHGDDIGGDCIYSARLSTAPAEDSVKTFFAAYGEIRSNKVAVKYLTSLTEEDLAAIDMVGNKVSALVSSPEFEQATYEERRLAAETLLNELAKSNLIVADSICYDDETGVFGYEFRKGIKGFVRTRKSNPSFGNFLKNDGKTA